MAFTLTALVGSSSVVLSDGNPFKLVRASGMGGASVRRVTAQGPSQHGDTDLGYRLQPRTIELVVGFHASTDALLDAHRDTLTSIFKPLSSTPVKLRVTRDDAGVRQIDCYVVGALDINLVPDHRPGHYHEATVRLRAAEPAWYGVAPGTVTTTGTAGIAENWYLAGGAIGTAQVLMSGGSPAQGEVWDYSGTVAGTESYAIAFRAINEPVSGSKFAFSVDNDSDGAGGTTDVYFATGGAGYVFDGIEVGTAGMMVGTANYFVRHRTIVNSSGQMYLQMDELYRTRETGKRAGPFDIGPISYVARRTIGATSTGTVVLAPISGTARRWRSDASNSAASRWEGAIPIYALYSPELEDSQMAALHTYMDGAIGGTVAQAVAVPYEGDLPEYPVISITGPIDGPSITNTVTGDTLDFGTISIGAGTTYVIDTRYGVKTVTQGTVNKRGELTADSDLGAWHLAPDPVAAGGVNVIAVAGTNSSTATAISIAYYNRFSSF